MTRAEAIRILEVNKPVMTKRMNTSTRRYVEAFEMAISTLSAEPCEDAISRQAVLDELEKWDWQELYLPIHFKENIIDVLPSVQPVPCEDAVSREEVSRWYCNTTCNMDYCTEPCLEHKELMLLPSVQPKKEDNTMDIYSDLLRVKHGTMSIDSLIDKVWCGRKAVKKNDI